jgi:hypothetical protein
VQSAHVVVPSTKPCLRIEYKDYQKDAVQRKKKRGKRAKKKKKRMRRMFLFEDEEE